MPSKKSKTAARIMSASAMSILPSRAQITPRMPESRFMDVIALGMLKMRIYLMPNFLRISLGTEFLFTRMFRVLPLRKFSDMYQMPS